MGAEAGAVEDGALLEGVDGVDCADGVEAGAGVACVSPPTGVVPGAGWAGVLAGVVLDPEDCAKTPAERARPKPTIANNLECSILMTPDLHACTLCPIVRR